MVHFRVFQVFLSVFVGVLVRQPLSVLLQVYAPVAPTKECLALLQPLIDEHGPVREAACRARQEVLDVGAREVLTRRFWAPNARYTRKTAQNADNTINAP